jgi:hypothetical protein
VKVSWAHGEATGSQVAGRDIPAATAIMKTTARCTGEPRGSSGLVTAWSLCAHEGVVLVCLETEDGLGLRAHNMERHGRSRRSGGEQRKNRGLTVGVVEERMAVQ